LVVVLEEELIVPPEKEANDLGDWLSSEAGRCNSLVLDLVNLVLFIWL